MTQQRVCGLEAHARGVSADAIKEHDDKQPQACDRCGELTLGPHDDCPADRYDDLGDMGFDPTLPEDPE